VSFFIADQNVRVVVARRGGGSVAWLDIHFVTVYLPAGRAQQPAMSSAKDAAAPSAPKPSDSILLRHKRDAYYFAITVFVCNYLFPLDEATAAFAQGPTDGASEYAQRHWHWIATIVLRDLALCTIIYGGYHMIMYEGLGRVAIEKLQADGKGV
jgi:predicted secreted protein